MDTTPNLKLPYILAAQAQKHVTHNEAIRALDAIIHISVSSRVVATPPADPSAGERYIIATEPTGAWAGQASKLAAWQDGAWEFYSPLEGWIAWVRDEGCLVAWNGEAWSDAVGALPDNVPLLGINTTADTTTRLAVAAAASLFSHAGAGHQHKINKAAAGDTASLLFQTGFSGRAEIGTVGDDDLHVKVSADGSAWVESAVFKGNGRIGIGTAAPANTLHFKTTDIATRALFSDGDNSVGYDAIVSIGSEGDRTPLVLAGGSGLCQFWNQYAVTAAMSFGLAVPGEEPVDDTIFATYSELGGWNARFRIVNDSGDIEPGADNAQDLGTSSKRWANVYAANGTIQTSDARDKVVEARLDATKAVRALEAIEPVMFRWQVGGYEQRPSEIETVVNLTGATVPKMEWVPRPGVRLHAGFLAQEVKAVMDEVGVDFGVWGLEDPADADSRQWLRPDQIIPVLWAALRETRAELAALRAQVEGA